MDDKTEVIARIRAFNRFYTVMLGMLDRNFLSSPYSVTETRTLFEISAHAPCSANFLTETLHVDKSYISRILKSFQRQGLVTKCVSPTDGRAYLIQLTDQGQHEVEQLIQSTNCQIGVLIQALNENQCRELCHAMDTITKYLSGSIDE